jgi:hypothetical protein
MFLIGGIITYFYQNVKAESSEVLMDSEITRLNLYLLKITKTPGIKIKNYGLVESDDLSSYYITFENKDGSCNTFLKVDDIIYFNKIKLCENVEEFKVIVDKSSKESISVEVKIGDKVYNTQYAI